MYSCVGWIYSTGAAHHQQSTLQISRYYGTKVARPFPAITDIRGEDYIGEKLSKGPIILTHKPKFAEIVDFIYYKY